MAGTIGRSYEVDRSGKWSIGAEDLGQFERRSFLKLVVAAVLGLLVGPPALEGRGMPEAVALQVVVCHLRDALDAQRLP